MTYVLLCLGLGLLLAGGFALVNGASQLARAFGIPSFVVGLTVVAFGTSAPELAVNGLAAIQGNAGVSFGNVIGSNLANVGLILGIAGLMAPLTIESVVLRREIPMMLLATAAAVVMGLDVSLRGGSAAYDRSDGLLLLLFFSVFLYTATATVLRKRESDPLLEQSSEALPDRKAPARSAVLVVLGLAGLGLGADLTVDNAVVIASAVGVSPAIIGLSIVAIGTSLPELVASVVAVGRGETDLAVGNVVGSNVFNLLFILGITGTIAPVPVPAGGVLDLIALAVVSVLVLVFSFRGRTIDRLEALVLLGMWVAYGSWRVFAGALG